MDGGSCSSVAYICPRILFCFLKASPVPGTAFWQAFGYKNESINFGCANISGEKEAAVSWSFGWEGNLLEEGRLQSWIGNQDHTVAACKSMDSLIT